MQKVFQVRGVAGTESCALADQRRHLQRALGEDPLAEYRSRLHLWRVAAIAGWIAYDAEHMVTVRMVAGDSLQPWEVFLMRQLLREARAWECQASREALARCIAGTYHESERLESLAIEHAVEQSLAAARKRKWRPCSFLRDATQRGRDFARHQPDQAAAVLEELGENVQRSTDVFESLLGHPVARATEAQAWEALQEWLPRTYGATVSSGNREQGLLVLRHACDFLFWFGLLRAVSRRAGRTGRVERDQPAREISPPAPDWAADFIGREFDPAAARGTGWFDQGSPDAHCGVEQGDGVWMFKIDHMSAHRCCSHVWWRFLFVKLDSQRLIVEMRTQVDEVLPDGHCEMICDEFQAVDVGIAIAALQHATGGDQASQ